MTVQNRKAIFAFCRELKISEDERHALVNGITGKESLTELTEEETTTVINELIERMKIRRRSDLENQNPKSKVAAVAGMMTAEQQSLAWRLVYRLRELDDNPSRASAGERMAGVIRKELGITATAGKNIFMWISFEDGSKLIEKLKCYVRSAERKAKRG